VQDGSQGTEGTQATTGTEGTTAGTTEGGEGGSGGEGEGKPALSARELALEQIAQQNDERIDAEHVEKGMPAVTKPASTQSTSDDTQLQTQLETGQTILSDGLDKIFVSHKVDGVEKLVSVADMRRDAQKNQAADKRLEEAAAASREAARLLAEAKQTIGTRTAPPVGVEGEGGAADSRTQSQTTDGQDPAATRQKLVKALFEGDEEGALSALEQIGVGRPSPTPADLATAVTPAVKQQLAVEDALAKFVTDFKDIVSDPHLADIADGFLAEEQQVPNQTYAQSLEKAGTRTRDWLAAKGVTPKTEQADPTITRAQKLEFKQGIDNVQGLNKTASTTEEPIPTASDTIKEMRQARGMAV